MVLRKGLTRTVEINTSFEVREDKYTVNSKEKTISGLSDFAIGSRINLYDRSSGGPIVGTQISFKTPILSEVYNSSYLTP